MLLRQIGGFDEPTESTTHIGGEPMTGIAAEHRPTDIVFQSCAIFPHLNVAENVGFGLKIAILPRAERDRRVAEPLEQVCISPFDKHKGSELSVVETNDFSADEIAVGGQVGIAWDKDAFVVMQGEGAGPGNSDLSGLELQLCGHKTAPPSPDRPGINTC